MKGFAVYRHDGSVFITNDIDLAVKEVIREKYLFPEKHYSVVRLLE